MKAPHVHLSGLPGCWSFGPCSEQLCKAWRGRNGAHSYHLLLGLQSFAEPLPRNGCGAAMSLPQTSLQLALLGRLWLVRASIKHDYIVQAAALEVMRAHCSVTPPASMGAMPGHSPLPAARPAGTPTCWRGPVQWLQLQDAAAGRRPRPAAAPASRGTQRPVLAAVHSSCSIVTRWGSCPPSAGASSSRPQAPLHGPPALGHLG